MSVTVVASDVEIRSGEGFQVADVNFPKRIVTVVGMPYERPAEIQYGDRIVSEIVTRGAFDGIEKRAGQIRANRDHSWDKLVGKLVGLHPSRKEGLVADIKMFETALGEETLRICDEDGLNASAGFRLLRRDDGRVYADAEVWNRSRTVRRLNRLHLDHLALVPNPAYAETPVLDVRDALGRPGSAAAGVGGIDAAGTPNRDRLALDGLRARFDEIDRRWPH